MVRRLLCAGLAGLCLGALGGPVAAQADTGDIIAPQNSPADANDGWQAGTCLTEPCSPSTPGGLLHPGRRPPADRLHPVHRQAHDASDPWKTRSASSRTSGSTCRSGSASTRRPRPSATSRPSPPTRPSARPTRSSGRASSPPRSPGSSPRRSPSRSTTSSPARANRRCSASAPSARTSSSKPDVDWSGDYHEGFTIAVPDAPGSALKILKNRLVFSGARRQRDLPDHPQHLPRPRSGRLRPHLLDLPAGRLGRGPRPRLPQRLEPLRGRPAAGDQADGLRDGAVQTRDRRVAGHRPHRLARRRHGRCHRPLRTAAADRPLQRAYGADHAAARHGPQPLRRRRPRRLHRRPVRQGHQEPGRLPGRVEDRHGRGRNPAAAARLADRQRLRRQAAQPRPDLRPGVPDLRRRRVGPLRRLGEADRQRRRRPEDRPPDDDLRREPAGPVQLLQAPFRRRPAGGAEQPARLRPERVDRLRRPLHRNGDGDRRAELHAARGAGRRRLREDARRATLRTGLLDQGEDHESRRLQPLLGPHLPRRRPAGAEGRRRHPAGGPERQAQGHPVLQAGRRSPPAADRAGEAEAEELELSVEEQGRGRDDPRRHRLGPDPDQGQRLPRGPLQGRAALAGGDRRRPSQDPSTSAPSSSASPSSSNPRQRGSGPSPTRSRTSSAAPSSASARSTSTPTGTTSRSTRPAAGS